MADLLSAVSGGKGSEAGVDTVESTDAPFPAGTPSRLYSTRPRSTHCDFRESRRWAKANVKWIDGGNRHAQHTLDRRRASEDLLRPQPLSATFLESETEKQPHHQRTPSDTESLEHSRNLNCLSRSLSTGNWLKIRQDTAQRKIQAHHQLGRFIRKITDTGNWTSKEPTVSLDDPGQPKEGDDLAHTALQIEPGKPSTRRGIKLSKKPGMDNIRAQKEAADKAHEMPGELNTGGIINLNAAEDVPTRSEKIPALREEDIEETKRQSADLREALSEYHSDRHGNLLPEINTDAIGDLGTVDQQNNEQHAPSESSAERHHGSDHLHNVNSMENNAWKTSNPSTSNSPPNSTSSPPQPGPRISSRHGAVGTSSVRRRKGSPVTRPSAVAAPELSPRGGTPDSFATEVEPLNIAGTRDEMVAVELRERISKDALSGFKIPPNNSTDTLTAITNEALGSNRPLTPSNLTDVDPTASKPSTRPTKLHSGFVSSTKAPGDAPNRPLPDLPEIPSPESSEESRRGSGSRASSRSRCSLQRTSIQPGHNRRASSSACTASLEGVLQATGSPHGSPHRRSNPVQKIGSVRPSLQKLTSHDQISAGNSFQVHPPDLRHSDPLAAYISGHVARETVSRDQRIHDKRLQDIASARARRGKRAAREDYSSLQVDAAAKDFPVPPSSHSQSRAKVDRPNSDLRATTANTSSTYLPNPASLQRPQAQHVSPVLEASPLANHVLLAQPGEATGRWQGASPMPAPAPARTPTSTSRVMEPLKTRRIPKSKHSHVSLRSKATIEISHNVNGSQTPPLSESSTPSSDEDGTGVMGASTTHPTHAQKGLHLSTCDLTAMVADMHAMREQLDAQLRQIQSQSKQIRAIEMQKLRIVDAVNALVAVVSAPNPTLAPVRSASKSERHFLLKGVKASSSLKWQDRDSIASTTNTVASGDSASSRSEASDMTFITEPDAFSNGLEQAQEGIEFNMDFDRMQELIKLDRRKVGSGSKRGKSKKSGGAVGYLTIDA